MSLGPELKLGGNGPVIAKRMLEEGADVLLAIQNEKVWPVYCYNRCPCGTVTHIKRLDVARHDILLITLLLLIKEKDVTRARI